MKSFLSTRAVRLFLAVSVSVWMAGGCLFGCSSNVMAHESEDSAPTIVAGESCHAERSHDCCASQKPKKQIARSSQPPTAGPSFNPEPRGTMKDCPLVVNATAATSKNSSHLPDPARGSVAVLPFVETASENSDTFLVVPVLLNRGPTYLRCCVFLI
jgi:hypothetical protein